MHIHVVGTSGTESSVLEWLMRRDFAEHIFSTGAAFCEYSILVVGLHDWEILC